MTPRVILLPVSPIVPTSMFLSTSSSAKLYIDKRSRVVQRLLGCQVV